MKVVTVICKKGGVGKSVTSVSLACGLARRGYRTLLVDTDSQGSAGLCLGYRPSYGRDDINNLGQVFFENVPLKDVIYATWLVNLDIVLASTNLVKLDSYYAGYENKLQLFTDLFTNIQDSYDYIVIDTPPALSMITVASLVASDGYIIPVPPLSLDIQSVHMLLAEINELRKLCAATNSGSVGNFYGILLTRVRRYKTVEHHIQQLKNFFVSSRQNFLFEASINESVKVPESTHFGKDVYTHSKRSQPAKAYEKFVDELLVKIK